MNIKNKLASLFAILPSRDRVQRRLRIWESELSGAAGGTASGAADEIRAGIVEDLPVGGLGRVAGAVQVLLINVARGNEQLETLRFEAVNPTFLLCTAKAPHPSPASTTFTSPCAASSVTSAHTVLSSRRPRAPSHSSATVQARRSASGPRTASAEAANRQRLFNASNSNP